MYTSCEMAERLTEILFYFCMYAIIKIIFNAKINQLNLVLPQIPSFIDSSIYIAAASGSFCFSTLISDHLHHHSISFLQRIAKHIKLEFLAIAVKNIFSPTFHFSTRRSKLF